MKKRICKFLGAAVLCAALLSGCAGGQEAPPAESTAPTDPLTGQPLYFPGERVAAVVIDNSPSTAAQWGIGSASVVLEAQTKADAPTSLCLVYPALRAMPTVGPVCAGQDLYWRLLSGQQVLPIQNGSELYARNYLDYIKLRAVDALEVGRNAFFCDDVWNAAPLWRTSGSAVGGVLESLNLTSTLPLSQPSASEPDAEPASPALPAFLPQAEDTPPEPTFADASAVWIDFPSESATGFAYNATYGTYGMSRADGSAQLDSNTGEQAEFDNVLVLYSSSTLRDDEQSLDYDLTMGGGVWLNGGRLWLITWTQGVDSTFSFYDADGETLNILPGRSYLALLSSVTGQELRAFSSTGEDLLTAN